MAKGDSEFAVAGPECQEVAGEHRRAVARPHRGRSPGTGDPDQAASMGVGPKTWARGEPDAWERARPVRRCGPGKRTLRKKHTAPRPDPYLTLPRWRDRPRGLRRAAVTCARTGVHAAAPNSAAPAWGADRQHLGDGSTDGSPDAFATQSPSSTRA